MGTWIEIRCETVLVEGYTRCWSRRNEWPGEMADDANVAKIDTLRHISKRAKKLGWIKTRVGWVCPYCLTQTSIARCTIGGLYGMF